MGRSYWFECARCGYRAKVSGRADRGINLFVETIVCQDCKQLYDVVTRIRLPDEPRLKWLRHATEGKDDAGIKGPPTFQSALNRLTVTGAKRLKWFRFPAQCPVASFHRIKSWTDPDKCPRCGIFLEKNALPFRIWE